MVKSQASLFFVLIFCSSIAAAEGDSTYFQIRDSIISSFKLDLKEVTENFLSANLSCIFTDASSDLPENIRGCSNPLIISAKIENRFDEKELELLREKPNATFEDSAYFLLDNDIAANLYRVKVFNHGEVSIFEKIGLDINVNFPEVIEVSYFAQQKIVMTENLECGNRLGVFIMHIFDEKSIMKQTIIYRNGQTEIITRDEK